MITISAITGMFSCFQKVSEGFRLGGQPDLRIGNQRVALCQGGD